jgi:hypothetical protein
VLLVAAGPAACDVKGTPHDQRTVGPPIAVLGTNIDGSGGSIAADGVIQIAFDRYLLPSTIRRQSFSLLDSSRTELVDQFGTIYDPVARTVTITGPAGPGKAWLVPEQTYRLILKVPADPDSDVSGFRAIDRAALAAPREYVFRARQAEKQEQLEPAVDFCADVLPLFKAKCGAPACHGSTDQPAASLILESSNGVQTTAIARLAQSANTGPSAFSTEEAGRIFGLDMPIITPGDPGSSWLMYKIELAPQPVVDAGPAPNVVCTPPPGTPLQAPAPPFTPLPFAQTSATDAERTVLSNYVLGREMPYPSLPINYLPPDGYVYTPLSFQERERVRLWIARGAKIYECGGCGIPEAPKGEDAGATDAAATDAAKPDSGVTDAGITDAADQ